MQRVRSSVQRVTCRIALDVRVCQPRAVHGPAHDWNESRRCWLNRLRSPTRDGSKPEQTENSLARDEVAQQVDMD